jgi:thioesterase domain-containing protein
MTASTGIGLTRNTNTNTTALFGQTSRNSDRVILPINDAALRIDTEGPAFYCVHSASGVAGTDFLALAQHLEPSIRFYGIQAPAKQMQDVRFGSSVESIAEFYVDALVKFQPTGPFILGGYCVGAIVALAMAKNLRARGREVGPLLVIDGVPENTAVQIPRWRPRNWLDMFRNLRGWMVHGDLMRNRTLRSLIWSLTNNAYAIGKSALGLRRGQKLGGGYSIAGIMDLSPYQPTHCKFIERLFNALFAYVPRDYSGKVVVYEAKITPLLYLPQIGQIWQKFAPQTEVVNIVGTHISMMRDPYVGPLAKDVRARIDDFYSSRPK